MLAPNIVADDVTNAVDAFDRDLGLERIGPDIVNTQPQRSAAETSDFAANPKKNENHRKSPTSQAALSADSLTFHSNQRVTDSLRGFMIAKVTQNDMAAIPAADFARLVRASRGAHCRPLHPRLASLCSAPEAAFVGPR